MAFTDSIGASSGPYLAVKRMFDLTLVVLLLPAFLLAVFVVGFLNPLLNQGPLFFVQRRMGQHFLPFTMIKFRTLKSDGSSTRFGRLMRKSRVDELPQILNVLRGEMSFIGPRPDIWERALDYIDRIPGYKRRHDMRPGISGLAQVRHGYIEGEERLPLKVAADLEYVRKASIVLDLKIVLETVATVFMLKGR